MNVDLMGALDEIARQRGVDRETLLEALEQALISAYRRHFGTKGNVEVAVDPETAAIRVVAFLTVVEDPEAVEEDEESDPEEGVEYISLEEARMLDPDCELGDVIQREVTPDNFGRIAAQTARQVVMQRIREAERSAIYDEYISREGDIITGIVRRFQGRNAFIDLGRTEAILPGSEQIPGERLRQNQRLKCFILEVRKSTKGAQVVVSRSHPGLLKRLFELEVPEIHDGTVEIRGVAREAGNRSKLAVHSLDDKVDPVGACVGTRGIRVQAVVRELNDEKIDVVQWSDDTREYIANALSPAQVLRVILKEHDGVAEVVVPDHQLSLAIGKAGQNARLSAKLTGWKIDIKSETQFAEALEQMRSEGLLGAGLQHDEPVTVEELAETLGRDVAETLELLVAEFGVEVEDAEDTIPAETARAVRVRLAGERRPGDQDDETFLGKDLTRLLREHMDHEPDALGELAGDDGSAAAADAEEVPALELEDDGSEERDEPAQPDAEAAARAAESGETAAEGEEGDEEEQERTDPA